ncbi:MAG: RtcB family protein [Nitrospira sp.]
MAQNRPCRSRLGLPCLDSGKPWYARAGAKQPVRGEQVQRQMAQQGIILKAVSMSGLASEAGFAYKNISDIVALVNRPGITKKATELRPSKHITG